MMHLNSVLQRSALCVHGLGQEGTGSAFLFLLLWWTVVPQLTFCDTGWCAPSMHATKFRSESGLGQPTWLG